MASTLLMSTFDVPFNAINVSPAAASDEDLSVYNWIGGERYAYGQFAAAAASNSVRYDLGSSTTKSANHLIIARANMLKTAGVTAVALSRGTDGVVFNNEYNDAAFASATLYGPKTSDYLAEFTASTAYEWWKITYTAVSTKFPHSKISFGTALDLGKNVDSYSINRIPAKEAVWRSDSGAEYQNRISDEVYQFTFTWRNLTSAIVQTFFERVARWKHIRPLFLYTPAAGAQHVLLDNQRVMHVKCIDATRSLDYGSYQILTATFEEILG